DRRRAGLRRPGAAVHLARSVSRAQPHRAPLAVAAAVAGRLAAGPDQRLRACQGRLGGDAGRAGALGDRAAAGLRLGLAGARRRARGRCAMNAWRLLSVTGLAAALAACGGEQDVAQEYGASPTLPAPERGLLPSMKIAEPAEWGERKPTVPQGFSITAIATDL